jgi:hypothetical protein
MGRQYYEFCYQGIPPGVGRAHHTWLCNRASIWQFPTRVTVNRSTQCLVGCSWVITRALRQRLKKIMF